MPDSVLTILRDVVNLRKKSFNFFSRATKDTKDEKIKQSNANHAHIIGVLERVLAKLEAVVRPARSTSAEKSKEDSSVPLPELQNLFARLEVQSPSGAGEDAPSESEEDAEAGPSTAPARAKRTSKRKAIKKAFKRKHDRRLDKSASEKKKKKPTAWVDDFHFCSAGRRRFR